jgi:hypothetical protein
VIVPALVVVDASVVVVPVTGFVDVVVVVLCWASAVFNPAAKTAANIFSNLVCFIFVLCFG